MNFTVVCFECGQYIEAGQLFWWNPSGWHHVGCPAKPRDDWGLLLARAWEQARGGTR
jgi:hypothetical protein